MIVETIVTTQNKQGDVHIAPMGIHDDGSALIILPFKPSTTLENFLSTGVGVINYCDDVRVFAGCLTGRKDWALLPVEAFAGSRLACALAHSEVRLTRIEEDATRPKLFCTVIETFNHAPFRGFNRAQYAVLEAAILVSRLHMLPLSKIESELDYLRIGLEKTAGSNELTAWDWLMRALDDFKTGRQS